MTNQSVFQKTALGIDARNQSDSLTDFPRTLTMMEKLGIDCDVIYLQAEPDILYKRFSETRRKHPLTNSSHTLADAIELERQLLKPIAKETDLIIDTTRTNMHQLRELIRARIGKKESRLMSLYFQSFGFKNGLPMDTDFVFDARCLPNPHWEPLLRNKTGKDKEVADFLLESADVRRYLQDLQGFLYHWVARFDAENRSYLTVAIGCTGGQHRSVFLAESLAEHFRGTDYDVLVGHRELDFGTSC